MPLSKIVHAFLIQVIPTCFTLFVTANGILKLLVVFYFLTAYCYYGSGKHFSL